MECCKAIQIFDTVNLQCHSHCLYRWCQQDWVVFHTRRRFVGIDRKYVNYLPFLRYRYWWGSDEVRRSSSPRRVGLRSIPLECLLDHIQNAEQSRQYQHFLGLPTGNKEKTGFRQCPNIKYLSHHIKIEKLTWL